MRAYLYFWGTRAWGKMPIITEPWMVLLNNIAVPRSSLEKVKEQILSDIESAIGYFNILIQVTNSI